jgi:murein DD-endopeptidase MepM/ murein hydrolase activator NlpD
MGMESRNIGTVKERLEGSELVDKGVETGVKGGKSIEGITRREFLKSAVRFAELAGVSAIGGLAFPKMAHSNGVYGPDFHVTSKGMVMNFKGHEESENIHTYRGKKILGNRYSVNRGSKIVTPAGGNVLTVINPYRPTGGPIVWFDHGNGYVSLIYYLESLENLEQGSYIERGTLVGTSTSRGVRVRSGQRTRFQHFYAYAFGKVNEQGSIDWIDPDTQGENGGRPKIYDGRYVQDHTPREKRVFFKDITKLIRESFTDNSIPDELNDYFSNPLRIPSSQFIEILKKYGGSFKPETIEKYDGLVKKMLDSSLKSPVLLTHTYGSSK